LKGRQDHEELSGIKYHVSWTRQCRMQERMHELVGNGIACRRGYAELDLHVLYPVFSEAGPEEAVGGVVRCRDMLREAECCGGADQLEQRAMRAAGTHETGLCEL
jgi:hypothetical protein